MKLNVNDEYRISIRFIRFSVGFALLFYKFALWTLVNDLSSFEASLALQRIHRFVFLLVNLFSHVDTRLPRYERKPPFLVTSLEIKDTNTSSPSTGCIKRLLRDVSTRSSQILSTIGERGHHAMFASFSWHRLRTERRRLLHPVSFPFKRGEIHLDEQKSCFKREKKESLEMLIHINHAKCFKKFIEIDHTVLVQIDTGGQVHDLLFI